jgi:hypothetical protein
LEQAEDELGCCDNLSRNDVKRTNRRWHSATHHRPPTAAKRRSISGAADRPSGRVSIGLPRETPTRRNTEYQFSRPVEPSGSGQDPFDRRPMQPARTRYLAQTAAGHGHGCLPRPMLHDHAPGTSASPSSAKPRIALSWPPEVSNRRPMSGSLAAEGPTPCPRWLIQTGVLGLVGSEASRIRLRRRRRPRRWPVSFPESQ